MSEKQGTGYHSTFMNFVENTSPSGKKDEVDNNDSESSSDNTNNKKSTPVVPKSNTAKKGRLLGPKSARARLSKSEAIQNNSDKEPDDDNEAPHRRRSTRAAKQKAVAHLCGGSAKKSKKAISESDHDSNHDADPTVDDDDDFVPDSEPKRGLESDSDEDPVWNPQKKFSSAAGSAKKSKCGSGSDEDDYRPSKGRGRGRKRGATSTSSRVGSSKSSEKPLPDVVPPRAAPSPAATPAAESTSVAASTVKPTLLYAPRPVGRPPTVAVIGSSAATAPAVYSNNTAPASAVATPPPPVATTDNYIPDLNPAHNCQKGDFILDRRDMTNYANFPIWRIDSQRLLQKFEAFEKDGKLLHRALCTYSSWPVHAQQNYTAIGIRYVSCTRGKEVVEVFDKYKPRPVGVQGQELDSLREAFTIYTQILLSQALEPTFIRALIEEPDDYYTVPLDKVTALIKERVQKVSKLGTWKSDFLGSLRKYHAYTLIDCPDSTSFSQATDNNTDPAKKSVKFYGHAYNSETLQSLEQVTEANGPEYFLTASESVVLTVLHGLYHLMFKLCLVCQTRVEELKVSKPDIEDHVVLDTSLRDQPWMQQMFSRLKSLLENADRVAGC